MKKEKQLAYVDFFFLFFSIMTVKGFCIQSCAVPFEVLVPGREIFVFL